MLLVGNIGSVGRESLDSETGDDGIGLLDLLPQDPSGSGRAAAKRTGGLYRKRLYGPGRSPDRVFGTGGSVPNGERRKAIVGWELLGPNKGLQRKANKSIKNVCPYDQCAARPNLCESTSGAKHFHEMILFYEYTFIVIILYV